MRTTATRRRERGDPAAVAWSPFVVAGRVVLVVAPLLLVLPWLTRVAWVNAPDDAGVPDHPIPVAAMLAAFAIGALWPVLLLPVGSPRWAGVVDDVLIVSTVLGRRRVELDELVRAGGWRLIGRGSDTYVLTLRDRQGRRVVLARAGTAEPPAAVRAAVLRLHERDPGAVSARIRTRLGLGPQPGLAARCARGALTALLFLTYCWGIIVLGALLAAAAGVMS